MLEKVVRGSAIAGKPRLLKNYLIFSGKSTVTALSGENTIKNTPIIGLI